MNESHRRLILDFARAERKSGFQPDRMPPELLLLRAIYGATKSDMRKARKEVAR